MNIKNKISEGLESKLNLLQRDEKIRVIILGLRVDRTGNLPTSERRLKSLRHYENSVKPIEEYLKKHNIPISYQSSIFGAITASMNPKQIYELAKEEDIYQISDDKLFHRI